MKLNLIWKRVEDENGYSTYLPQHYPFLRGISIQEWSRRRGSQWGGYRHYYKKDKDDPRIEPRWIHSSSLESFPTYESAKKDLETTLLKEAAEFIQL